MDTGQDQQHSHLFMLRVWSEQLGETQREWRGEVEHVMSGERHYFRDWSALVSFLLATLAQLDGSHSPAVTDDSHPGAASGSAANSATP